MKSKQSKPCKRKKCPYYNVYFDKCIFCEWNPSRVWTEVKEKNNMEVRVDNYYISTQDFKYIKVCLDGQNIIHEKCEMTKNRRTLVDEGIGLINKYNRRHDLKWGELD